MRIAARTPLGENDLFHGQIRELREQLRSLSPCPVAPGQFQCFQHLGTFLVASVNVVARQGPVPDGKIVQVTAIATAEARDAGGIADAQVFAVECADRAVEGSFGGPSAVHIDDKLARGRRGNGLGHGRHMVPASRLDAAAFSKDVLPIALPMVQAEQAIVDRHMVGILGRGAPIEDQPIPAAHIGGENPHLDRIGRAQLHVQRSRCRHEMGVIRSDAQGGSLTGRAGQFRLWNKTHSRRSSLSVTAGEIVVHLTYAVLQRTVKTPKSHQPFVAKVCFCSNCSERHETHKAGHKRRK